MPFYYRIKAINSDNYGILSNEIVIDVNSETVLAIYPNPVDDFLNFEFIKPEDENISISIMDLQGKIYYKKENIYTHSNKKFQDRIQLNMLGNGVYQFLIKTSKDSYILKFVKISR